MLWQQKALLLRNVITGNIIVFILLIRKNLRIKSKLAVWGCIQSQLNNVFKFLVPSWPFYFSVAHTHTHTAHDFLVRQVLGFEMNHHVCVPCKSTSMISVKTDETQDPVTLHEMDTYQRYTWPRMSSVLESVSQWAKECLDEKDLQNCAKLMFWRPLE